ncbi:MAG: NAD(P)H-dependent oxidoreductase subunit E [Cetobacterium sp.]|uniref:NAD(P)H-dependent oxidoreductase subunit E n=1 Tax=Cetobacterium sp. TaxID=2071632 RepID=UPI003F3DD869
MKEFYKELDEYIENLEDKKNDYKVLSFAVDELGYLSDEVLNHIAKKMDIFLFSLESTIKFYPKLQNARTKNYVQICTGRNCNQPGLKEKLIELKSKVDFPIDERHCLGRCGKGRALKINEKYYSYKTLEELEKLLLNLK